MNFLIAIVGDSYKKAMDKADETLYEQRSVLNREHQLLYKKLWWKPRREEFEGIIFSVAVEEDDEEDTDFDMVVK